MLAKNIVRTKTYLVPKALKCTRLILTDMGGKTISALLAIFKKKQDGVFVTRSEKNER